VTKADGYLDLRSEMHADSPQQQSYKSLQPYEQTVHDQRKHIVKGCILRRKDATSHVVEHTDAAKGSDMIVSIEPNELTGNGCISRA
jgi:hypothetical protein